MPSNVSEIIKLVQRIPEGYVATYGQIAALAGIPRNARQVGTVLRQLPEDSEVPWHRVINSAGRISLRSDRTVFENVQRGLLEAEGVEFDDHDRILLAEYQWDGA